MRSVRLTSLEHRMSAPSTVCDFQKERITFLSWLEAQARLMRHQPKSDTLAEVKASLRDQSIEYLDRLKQASIVMACEAKDHICVTAKPPRFYEVDVPMMCSVLQLRLPQLASRLGVNAKCDMCVHFVLMNIVAEPGF
ncbi:hypothetical protein N7465_002878 [Penicillium sp. CMV-2018d]|nr:hypothetical protein N7465_002878 [Penicillium sp. CMV-2018d]